MILAINPNKPIFGSTRLLGDKSISHRAALFAALAEGTSHIHNFLVAGVTRAMLDNLTLLGISWQLANTDLVVEGKGLKGFQTPAEPLFCGNSATTLRLLTGAVSAAGVSAILDGSSGLRHRPMKRILSPLQSMGVPVTGSPQDTAPITIKSRTTPKLSAKDFTLQIASAQVKTTLLLAALNADSSTSITEPETSRNHSELMLQTMGVDISISPDLKRVRLNPPHHLTPLNINIPGDISSAAFLIVAACILPSSHLEITNVGLNPTRIGLLDTLKQMGANIQVNLDREHNNEPSGTIIVRYSKLRGTNISGDLVVQMIDEFPAFAVAAAYADGETNVSQAQELRYKETDRIATLCQEFNKLGANCVENPDGFTIQGQQSIQGGIASSHGDHRLGMALSILGLKTDKPTQIENAEIISESFPGFVSTLNQLGTQIRQRE